MGLGSRVVYTHTALNQTPVISVLFVRRGPSGRRRGQTTPKDGVACPQFIGVLRQL